MAKQIKIKGAIYDNDTAEIMRWWDYFDNTCPADIEKALAEADGDDVELIINSEGGMLISGLEMYCLLKKYSGKVTAYVQSFAASAATVVMMAASEIVAEPVSLVCIHNPAMRSGGDEHDLERDLESLRNIKTSILNAYDGKLKMSREEISDLMDKDIFISADQALEYGIINRIDGKESEDNTLLVASGTHLFPTPEMRQKYSDYLLEKKQSEEIENSIEIEKFNLLMNL